MIWVALLTGMYRLTLLAAAARRLKRPAPPVPDALPGVTVLVPAHDEEAGLGATLLSLQQLDAEIVVIADNCTDGTADVARAHGVTVLERDVPDLRGKGHALQWAWQQHPVREVVLIVDADCTVFPNLATALAARIAAGAQVVQADYRVANPEKAPLRYAGFILVNTIRPAGRAELGQTVILSGSGMALRRELGWHSTSVAEDREETFRLARAGVRVHFAHEARVESDMPAGGSRQQELRWETGRLGLVREFGPVALEALVPPQSAVAALNLIGLARRKPSAVVSTAMQAVFVLGGLKVAGAPPSVYRGLLGAPAHILRRIGLMGSAATGRGADEWVRTERPAPPR